MRTTVDLEERLFKKAKEYAARHNRTLASLIQDALRELLGRVSAPPRKTVVRLEVSAQRPGLCPGADLDNSSALLDLMDSDDPS